MTAVLVERRGQTGNLAERLLHGAGIRRGMHVLDVGCGAGDISLVAAKLTGPNGLVLGLDRDPAALQKARDRARDEEVDHAYFIDATLDTLLDDGTFDAVIGRHILDTGDPAAAVRHAARLLRPGGVMAFHESSPALLQVLEEAGLASPELFGGASSGRPQFCVRARKPQD